LANVLDAFYGVQLAGDPDAGKTLRTQVWTIIRADPQTLSVLSTVPRRGARSRLAQA
jgi:hypothetical protein